MNIIKPSYAIEGIFPDEESCLQWLERIGRTCYKSEEKITSESAPRFIRSILKLDRMKHLQARFEKLLSDHSLPDVSDAITISWMMDAVRDMLADPPHESVIEHSMMTVRFICDRGVSHEIVRHRLCAFSQESTRYCDYNKGDAGINVISPSFWDKEPEGSEGNKQYSRWFAAMVQADMAYNHLINNGAKPQGARSVLPNSLKTEIVVTANFREWRHIFSLRASKRAHPQMRELMVPLLQEIKAKKTLGLLFEDIEVPA